MKQPYSHEGLFPTRDEAVASAVRMNQIDPAGGWRVVRSRRKTGWWTISAPTDSPARSNGRTLAVLFGR